MKLFYIIVLFFFLGFKVYGQNNNDTIKLSKLTDEQVKQMIKLCWPNIKDTIYYGEYLDDNKIGFSRFESFLDSNNIEFGPVINIKSEFSINYLSYDIKEQSILQHNEIYQLISPFKLILNEDKEIKNGTIISNKTYKQGERYVSEYFDGRNIKIDTLNNFNYSLNEHWARDLFDIDTLSKINTILESNSNMNFENHKTYTSHTQLLKREKKLINGIFHLYITTKCKDELDDERYNIVDEYLTIVESKIRDYSHRLEPKEFALSINESQDLFFNCIIPVDIDYCLNILSYDSIKFSKVVFEFSSDKNPFETSNNQKFYTINEKTYFELNTQSNYVSIASKNEIDDNLKETNFYPVNDTIIIKMARDATKSAKSTKKKVELLINFVHNYIKYSKDDYSQHFISIYDIIKSKNGVCSDYAELFTVLARSIGIPCKTISGYALDPNYGYLGGHAWNEVEIKGKWYAVDPTWNSWLPSYYHFKASNENLSCSELNEILLKLKSITYINGKTIEFD
jgi:hypothetical protein